MIVPKEMPMIDDEALRAGPNEAGARQPAEYRLEPVSLGGSEPGIDLDRALSLADSLEDAEILRQAERSEPPESSS